MSSFAEQARRVYDDQLAPYARLLALRECALHFPLYGFRATWHHLIISARIPYRLEGYLESLVRAVTELKEARDLGLAHLAARTDQRRRDKAAGRRTPRIAHQWDQHGWKSVAYCPEPAIHPQERLAVIVERMISSYVPDKIEFPECLACGTTRALTETCPTCGVNPPGFYGHCVPDRLLRLQPTWQEIWSRSFVIDHIPSR
ncbi:hypothetical protein ACFFMN_06565 [Planobispora siamensis]|uniref:Uncharacterized protein n=1 Tax=Planobispora siamensis TaxID=936338 RepID=A0A8J3WR63_9ACTN|nr:hypothetical protein [Planobispora siamensis]GIH97742.1 hypothetical protein Psi01_83720 [Planobispora siamensis]